MDIVPCVVFLFSVLLQIQGQCPYIYRPVCTTNYRQFDNACLARMAGETVLYVGMCRDDIIPPITAWNYPSVGGNCACPKIYLPVCGSDHEIYDNECLADCAGVEVIGGEEECLLRARQQMCTCPRVFAPVCGSDFTTYDNECFAECAGVGIKYEGECFLIGRNRFRSGRYRSGLYRSGRFSGRSFFPLPAECPHCAGPYQPVCTTAHRTVYNRCTMECLGLELRWEGKCNWIGVRG